MDASEPRFEFGRNWLSFVRKGLDREKVEIAREHILDFLERSDLRPLSILDIGCGSGLHSLAMVDAGATTVHAFDFDPNSVRAAEMLHEQVGLPSQWTIDRGSVLDERYMATLAQFDLVYSWGVLHHTGDVWSAIRNAASKVRPHGLFYIALYSADVQVDPPPQFWLDVKQKYLRSGILTRRTMEVWYIWRFQMNRSLRQFPAFRRRAREYKRTRGMNIFTDIRDWLGGWPMEFVYDKDAVAFIERIGFKLKRIATGHANTEFLFVRNAEQ